MAKKLDAGEVREHPEKRGSQLRRGREEEKLRDRREHPSGIGPHLPHEGSLRRPSGREEESFKRALKRGGAGRQTIHLPIGKKPGGLKRPRRKRTVHDARERRRGQPRERHPMRLRDRAIATRQKARQDRKSTRLN